MIDYPVIFGLLYTFGSWYENYHFLQVYIKVHDNFKYIILWEACFAAYCIYDLIKPGREAFNRLISFPGMLLGISYVFYIAILISLGEPGSVVYQQYLLFINITPLMAMSAGLHYSVVNAKTPPK